MSEKEKSALAKAVKGKDGLISSTTMIKDYASGDHALVERLVSQGYLERVYRFFEGLKNATYSDIYYVVTEKGFVVFSSFPTRVWFSFKSNYSLWVGVVSIVVSLAALISTLYFSYVQNSRQNEEYILRNRPYLVMSDTEAYNLVKNKSSDFRSKIKNVGVFPAQILSSSFTCGEENLKNTAGKTIIGNGEHVNYIFSVTSNLGSGGLCKLLFTYSNVSISSNNVYSTEYNIRFTNDGGVIHENAIIH